MADITTIQVSTDTRKRLSRKKLHPKEAFDKVITRLLNDADQDISSSKQLSASTIKNIESALEDIKNGRVYSLSEVEKELDNV